MARPIYDETVGAKEIFGHDETNYQAVLTDTDGKLIVVAMGALVPSVYDTIDLTYTGSDLTGVVYKLGVATISTLTLTYTSGKLTKVEKT